MGRPPPGIERVDLDIANNEFVASWGRAVGQVTALQTSSAPRRADQRRLPISRDIRVRELTRNQRALLRRQFSVSSSRASTCWRGRSAPENVELPLLYRGGIRHVGMRRSRRARRRGSDGWEHHTPRTLRPSAAAFAIARAIRHQPLVLLADEPTGNLTASGSHEIMECWSRSTRARHHHHHGDARAMAYAADALQSFVDGSVDSDTHREAT